MLRTPNLSRGATLLVTFSLIAVILFTAAISVFDVAAAPLVATSPTLGTANSFAILAAEAITDAASTNVITGDVGLSPGTGAAIDITCAELTGTIYDTDGAYTGGVGGSDTLCLSTNPGLLTSAQADNSAAFTALSAGANAPCTQDFGPVVTDLSGMSLVPGVYCTDVGGVGAFTLTGTLTLVGEGVWIFRSGSTLITSGTANVVGGNSCDVWWRVPSSATLGTNTQLTGNILALTSITLANGATLDGRALAQTAAVTLDANTITSDPLCTASTDTPTPSNTPPPSSTPLPGPTSVPADTQAPTVAPLPTLTLQATATIPSVVGLPAAGGASAPRNDFLWNAVLAALAVGAIAIGLGVRKRRRTQQARR
jgi:hypothetical protein